jgi:hypothetical protein
MIQIDPQQSETAVETRAAFTPRPPRGVTVSPLDEYRLREGEVEPVGDAFAAHILAPVGRATVTPAGVQVKNAALGGTVHYWSDRSPLCSDLSKRGTKVVYSL